MRNYRAATARGPSLGLELTPEKERALVVKLFTRLCQLSNTPFANACYQKCQEGEFKELISLEFDPFFYTWNKRHAEFDLDYQIAVFFKAYPGLFLDIDKEAAAYKKWESTEVSCRKVNQYFRQRWEGKAKHLSFPVEEIYHLARRKITSVLGTVKAGDLDVIRSGCRHGPGGDLSLPKRNASAYGKYLTTGDITESALRIYDVLFSNDGNASSGDLGSQIFVDLANNALVVSDSRLAFVTKTSLVDRTIEINPRWNVFVQLGIGHLLDKRLLRCGVDLKDQSRNQEGARIARDEGLSTLDLSSASDSIAKNLVADLFQFADPLWWDLINGTRCQSTMYKGKSIRLEKISSNGNGYTFPLESLIFFAFAHATCRFLRLDARAVRVYGDDIIVPRAAFSQLVEVLEAFGFTVNTKKSFANGDFFESCGSDWYCGREVRPFFIKKNVATLDRLFTLHNQIVKWSTRPYGTLRPRYELAKIVAQVIPRDLRIFGPTCIEGVLHAPFDVWSHTASYGVRAHGWEGFKIHAYTSTPIKRFGGDYYAHLYSKLSGISDSGNWQEMPGSMGLRRTKVLITLFEDVIFYDVP
jgi:hypothetical protein